MTDAIESSETYRQLVAAIAERPEDDGTWHVLADYLLERGHPRGELMRIHFALEEAKGRSDAYHSLDRRRDELLVQHRELLFGRDAILIDLALGWRRGFIQWAAQPNHRIRDDALIALRSHPSAALLESLEIDPAQLHLYLSAPAPRLRLLKLRPRELQGSALRLTRGRLVREQTVQPEWADHGQPIAPGRRGAWLDLADLERQTPRLHSLALGPELYVDVTCLNHQTLARLEILSDISIQGAQGMLDRLPVLRDLEIDEHLLGQPGGQLALRGSKPTALERLTLTSEWHSLPELPLAALNELRGRARLQLLDLSSFELPRAAARTLAGALPQLDFVARVKIAGNGDPLLVRAVAAFNRRPRRRSSRARGGPRRG
jgi:uncharacterized protein (TIGR02996 family)